MNLRYKRNLSFEEGLINNCIKWIEINIPEIDKINSQKNELMVYKQNSEFKGIIFRAEFKEIYEQKTIEILNYKYILIKNKKEFENEIKNYLLC